MNKEYKILNLFFNEPTKHWHFEKILDAARISRPQAQQWLKKLAKDKIVRRIKLRKQMPYYIANYQNSNYLSKKKLYALEQLYSSGFLSHLHSLPNAKNITIFGSFARGDWHSDSDIDVFIYGDANELNHSKFRKKLHREIQVFAYNSKEELSQLSSALLRNILNGYHVKGKLDFMEVKPYA